ncbi:MAG TPA: hypothetical protein VK436_06190 [Methanocella sp.]|nr:hypothetical protein [Methanocella sp.]
MHRSVLLVVIVLMALALSGCCACCKPGLSDGDYGDNSKDDRTAGNAELIGYWSDASSSGGQYVSSSGEEGGYITNNELGRQIIFDENGQFNDTLIDASLWGGFMNIQTGDYQVDDNNITFSNVQVESVEDQNNPSAWTTKNIDDYTATYTIFKQDNKTVLELTWEDGTTTILYKG